MSNVEPHMRPPGSLRRWLLLCIFTGFCLRLAWAVHLPVDEKSLIALPDQLEYLHLAQHWLATGTLSFHDARFDQDVMAYRMPGYPALIALGGGSVRITRLLQVMIDTGSIFAVYLLSRTWLAQRKSLFAAWIIALNPWLIFFTGLLLGETWFTAMLTWGMLLLTRKRWWIGAILLVLSIYIRPSAVLLPTALACAVWSPLPVRRPSALRLRLEEERVSVRAISNDDDRSYAKSPSPQLSPGLPGEGAGKRVAMVFLLTGVLLLPWGIRNHQRLGEWVWLTTNGGITLCDGFNPAADGSSHQSFIQEMPWLRTMNELQRDHYFQQQAIDFARKHLIRSARLVGVKILRTWSPIPLSESYRSDARFILAGAAYSIPLFALTLLGLWRGSLSGRAKVFLLVPAMYITLVHGATIGSLRYRIPADVPLAVIAASLLERRVRQFETSSSMTA